MLIFILINVQHSQKAVPSFEKSSLHPVKKLPPLNFRISFFVDGVQLPQGYTEPLWGDSLVFTKNSWYSLNQSRKDQRLRWPWSHPVVLNLCISLVIIKYKLKSQFVILTQLWPLTVNCFKVSFQSKKIWQVYQKYVSFAHIRPNYYTISVYSDYRLVFYFKFSCYFY